jgi:hypothetical protein
MNVLHYLTLSAAGCLLVFAQVLNHRPFGQAIDFGYVLERLSVLVALWLPLEMLRRPGMGKRIYLDYFGRVKYSWSYLGWLASAGAISFSKWRQESNVPDCATWFDTTGKKGRLPGQRVHADKGPL